MDMHQGKRREASDTRGQAAADDLARILPNIPVDVPGERFKRDPLCWPATNKPHPMLIPKLRQAMAAVLEADSVAESVGLRPRGNLALCSCEVHIGVVDRFTQVFSIGFDPSSREKGLCFINAFPWTPEEYFSKADVTAGKADKALSLLITDEIITGPRSLVALVRDRIGGTLTSPVKAKLFR
jgi:hypothetical protein